MTDTTPAPQPEEKPLTKAQQKKADAATAEAPEARTGAPVNRAGESRKGTRVEDADADVRANDKTVNWDEYPINDERFIEKTEEA